MIFEPLRTERLLLRPMRTDDAASIAARRSDPDVARYQNWATPYPLERAQELVADIVAMDGPTNGEWWMLTIADLDDTTVLGDLVVHLSDDGHTAEIGYTLARDAWGHGYAVEAAEALVGHLFDTVGVSRVEGKLHPDNAASAMVLERIGLIFEGHTKLSFWLDGEGSDDWIYGVVRDDWEGWRHRPRQTPTTVRFVEITADNVVEVQRLVTHRTQQRFVSPVRESFADAMFPEVVDGGPLEPWMRAIEADGTLVGFVMVALTTEVHPEPYLWRLLVDRIHQRRGIGRAALDLLVEQCRAWGDLSLLTSWTPGKGSPEPLYLRYGFVPTGEIVDGETEGRLTLES
jgi:RimJ/RimL family protein N-acetyltransferase